VELQILNGAVMNKIFRFIVCLLPVASCEAPAEFDLPVRPPRLVINAVFVAGQDSTEVFVSLTRPGDSNDPWAVVPGAVVRASEEGGPVHEAVEYEAGRYRLHHPVKAATHYRVTVEHAGHAPAWGETTVPSPLEASIDTIPGERFVVNRWRDNPNERNIYWISHFMTDGTLPYAIYTASALVDPFNRDIDPFASITTCYTGYARVEDSGLQGQELELSYTYPYSAPGHPFILSADKHLDVYVKATKLAWDMYAKMEDLPLFYEPLYAYTNVHDGAGVIGSYVRFERFFSQEMPATEQKL
jgi:hypothetical protein